MFVRDLIRCGNQLSVNLWTNFPTKKTRWIVVEDKDFGMLRVYPSGGSDSLLLPDAYDTGGDNHF